MRVSIAQRFDFHNGINTEWEIRIPAHKSLIVDLPDFDNIDLTRKKHNEIYTKHWIILQQGVHPSLAGEVVSALASEDKDALITALKECTVPTPEAATLFLIKDNRVLATTRKTNRSLWGLPGGKVDEEDKLPDFFKRFEVAIKREAKEETGLIIDDLELVYNGLCRGTKSYSTTTFIANKVEGEIHTNEAIDVAFVEKESLLKDSPFSEYNRRLFSKIGLI